MSVKKTSVLILSDDRELLSFSSERLSQCGIHTILPPSAPSELTTFIAEAKPDIILSDIWFCTVNAMEQIPFLNDAVQKKNPNVPTWIIMFSGEEYKMFRTGLPKQVSYIIEKPFDTDLLADRIYRLSEYRENTVHSLTDEEESIATLLRQLCVPMHMVGLKYLSCAIDLAANDSSLLNSIIGELYPRVAVRFETSVAAVEKAIRSVILVSWNSCDRVTLRQFFGYQIAKNKPTSSAFIAVISDRIRMERNIARSRGAC